MGTPLQVLMVEDSEDDARLIVRELRKQGFAPGVERVETADAVRAALDRQRWDLVLADYHLPGFSGPQALEIVKDRGLDVPFILLSGAVGEEQAVAVMKAGAHDFLLKQSLARLGAAVARELREAEVRRERRRAEAALTLLANVSKLVTDAPDYRAVLRGAVQLVVPSLADWCILYSSGEHSILNAIEVAHIACIDGEALHRLARRYRPEYPPAPEEQHPIADALRTRQGVLTSDVTEDVLTRLARDEADRRLLQALGPRSMITLPLLVRDRLTGVWIFAATAPGRYTEADLGVAQELGGRIALVAENARLSRARDEFISTAVHEIKTPVAAIKLIAELMQRQPGDRASFRPELLARLDRQCNRLTRLVTNVLEVSRIELHKIALTRRGIDVSPLIEQVVGEMRGISPSHEIVIARNEPVTIGIDSDRIEQVLTNLIDNAVKYSPGGGQIEVASRREGDELIVSVRDHGIGIPADRQERIFERFYRAHASTPYEHAASLGVGLYLSRELVAHHGGRMWFESREGEGSTFYFSLPLTPPSHEQDVAAPRAESNAHERGRLVAR